MFKIESYITPLILSYVDKYIKNFRLEDSQVSLWSGEASFQNLDLRLEVLENELQLPFSFVSGHIHELTIHVPWTKLTSVPITITINTIECILKLKTNGDSAKTDALSPKKKANLKNVPETPPSYMQSLISKIVNNIQVHCNNFILKYVEEDIVLSMNVKHLKYESANGKWEPAFIEFTPQNLSMRKIVHINDLTLCLDKRNAAGKIDVYQEPMLYKCSLTVHILKCYDSVSCTTATVTRVDISCNNMEFCISEQQVPMLMRLLLLIYSLQQRDIKSTSSSSLGVIGQSSDQLDPSQIRESWSMWAWQYLSIVIPYNWEENLDQTLVIRRTQTMQIGFYVDKLSLIFKVAESSSDRSYYPQKKIRYWPILALHLQGICIEAVIIGIKWFNNYVGVSYVELVPVSACPCSYPECPEDASVEPYLKIGTESSLYKMDSLFDAQAIENQGGKKTYNSDWDFHFATNTEAVLLERTSALVMDYMYEVQIREDTTSDELSDVGSDMEYSNFCERICARICFGPLILRLCSGLFHRVECLRVAGSVYDYPPYIEPRPFPTLQELLPPSEEDYDALSECIPYKTMRITLLSPTVEVHLMNHPKFEPTIGNLFRSQKKLPHTATFVNPATFRLTSNPKLTLECQMIDISIGQPIYENRLIYTTCQLPDPPSRLFDACYVDVDSKVFGLCGRLVLNSDSQTCVLSPFSARLHMRTIIRPQYWLDPDVLHEDVTFESETLTLNGTKAKMMVISCIVDNILKLFSESSSLAIYNTSLLTDAIADSSVPYLEFCIEGICFKKVITNSTVCIDLSLSSIRAFIFDPESALKNDKDYKECDKLAQTRNINEIQQILFISGPEPKSDDDYLSTSGPKEDQPLFTATLQYPLSPQLQTHPSLMVFNLREIRICIDPLLCKWLLYYPNIYAPAKDLDCTSTDRVSETTVSESSKRSRVHGSVHSSSDRHNVSVPSKTKKCKEESLDIQEQVYNFLKSWFNVWKGMILCGDISQCTIYFPMDSLSAVGSQGIQEAVDEAMNKECPPDIMIITLPFANIRSAQRQSVTKFLKTLPVTLPQALWAQDKSSFPWTMSISDLSCYTIQSGSKLNFLKPLSLSATVGLSARPSKPEAQEEGVDLTSSTTSSSAKSDIGCLGICVHVDMTPIFISTSEVQVFLFASILYGLTEVLSSLLPPSVPPCNPCNTVPLTPFNDASERHAAPERSTATPDRLTIPDRPSVVSALSVPIPETSDPDTRSEHSSSLASQPPQQPDVPPDGVKLTAWVQWTITKCTMELLSGGGEVRLVVEGEDIVSSLDFQSVYLKVKSKIGSVAVMHYQRKTSTSPWKPGAFSGVILRMRDDLSSDRHHEDNGFINITVTRASCRHTHTMWGASKRRRQASKLLSPTRYITEAVVSVQPVDLIFSLKTLRSFYMILTPLMEIPWGEGGIRKEGSKMQICNQTLPLAYFDCQCIRLILPSSDLTEEGAEYDSILLQVQKITLNPTAVNPICRTPLKADIYQQAAQGRILNIPGSDIEDRQYQLDIIDLSISTGAWDNIEMVLSSNSHVMSSLHGASENPALEWNNLDRGHLGINPVLQLSEIAEKCTVSVVAAPAMIFRDTLVCGHSMEVNFVTDVSLSLALSQVKLVSQIINEVCSLTQPLEEELLIFEQYKLQYPYQFNKLKKFLPGTEELVVDSGFDSKSIVSFKANVKNTFARPRSALVPVVEITSEILLTGGKFSFTLYDSKGAQREGTKYKKTTGKRRVKIEEDYGYDGSEEGSIDERQESFTKFEPLIFLSVSQPNIFFCRHFIGDRIQVSCFNVGIKLNSPEYTPISHIPTESDFPIMLIETRSGKPNKQTGVYPAFFTVRYFKNFSRPATLDIEIMRPLKLTWSMKIINTLLHIHDKFFESFTVNKAPSSVPLRNSRTEEMPYYKYGKDSFIKFNKVKETFYEMNAVNVKFDQVLLVMEASNGFQLILAFNNAFGHIKIISKPERVTSTLNVNCVTLSTSINDSAQLFLNPWSFKFEANLFWESWQERTSDPQINFSVESDCVKLDLNTEHIKCMQVVINELNQFLSTLKTGAVKQSVQIDITEKSSTVDKEQYYKDDLRAGAFQFIVSSSSNQNELPLPYQVVFWSGNISAMSWRYPQPRALTKVRVFPVPYRMALDGSDNKSVICQLEYWSENHSSYMPYMKFYLSENEIQHLELPDRDDSLRKIVSCVWRVVMSTVDKNSERIEKVQTLVSVKALAACMRIDSYFNRSLIANLTAVMQFSRIDVALYNYIDKTSEYNFPSVVKNYSADITFPELQCFMNVSLENAQAHFSSWKFQTILCDLVMSTKCSILDYRYLTDTPLIESMASKLELNFHDDINVNFVSKPINIKFSPSAAHTLAISSQLWSENLNNNAKKNFILITNYIICNDSNLTLRFGQLGTIEDILLPSRYFHMYCWRSQKQKRELRVVLEQNDWSWSDSTPFSIDTDGIHMVTVSSECCLTLVVSVQTLSTTQKKIVFGGQLVISNMLLEHFEMKIIEAQDKDKDLQNAQMHVIAGKTITPSMFLNATKKYFLRLRFYGLNFTQNICWTGDIPLMEHTKGAQPWLVKVPLLEKGQFLSIWCRVLAEDFPNGKKILVMLWPLFAIRSNLPINAKVHIETPTLNVKLNSVVEGKGVLQQLYCPGTIDHSHQLTFNLENGSPTSTPYVPLNYSLVDHQQFFKKNDRESIEDIINILSEYGETKWPYFGEELEGIDWIVEDQPLTHVQVRYQNASRYSSALLLELVPWCLMVNVLGCPVSVVVQGMEMCRLQHLGIVAPPKLDDTFHLRINMGVHWHMSNPLHLSKSDWSQAFYMPTITGSVPTEGSIKTAVLCNNHMCMVLITSSIANDIRLLKISSTHVLTNHMSMPLQMVCFAVPDNQKIYDIPDNLEPYSFTVMPQLDKSKSGMSIIQWLLLDQDCTASTDFALYIAFSVKPKYEWSCPVRVDKPFLRRSICILTGNEPCSVVLTSQKHKEQFYLSLHNDTRPQACLTNMTGLTLVCGQSTNENSVAVESQHFNWRCILKDKSTVFYTIPALSEKFPDLSEPVAEVIAFSLADSTSSLASQDQLIWSDGINIANNTVQFLQIPNTSDIKVTVKNLSCTTYVLLESARNAEVSAKDIRVRLLQHEKQTLVPNTSQKESSDYLADFHHPRQCLSDSQISVSSYFSPPQAPLLSHSTDPERENASVKNHFSDTDLSSTSWCGRREIRSGALKVAVFLSSFSVTLLKDDDEDEVCELASVTCDGVAVVLNKTESMDFHLSICDIQLDNQLYSRETFDFPVVLVSQRAKPYKKVTSLNIPMEQLLLKARKNSVLDLIVVLETCDGIVPHSQVTGIRSIHLTTASLSAFIEDVYLLRLTSYLATFIPTRLVLWPPIPSNTAFVSAPTWVSVPELVLWQAVVLAHPFTVRDITIEPVSLLLSLHCSLKVYIALDQSPLEFRRFERRRMFTTAYRLGHALTMTYLSSAIFGAGWVVGSLELLGSPGGLARAMGTGLRDFVSMPYRGLLQGPWAFLVGVTHGSASLMRHVTAGTLQSLTKLASSVARNLDRLTLDEEHVRRAEEARRQRPQGLGQGLVQGLTGLGISVLSAVGGLAHHPLQSVMSDSATPRSLATGVGLGLVGVITKPLSGAAELLALAGQGLLQGAGWNSLPAPRNIPITYHIFSSSNASVKYKWKLPSLILDKNILFVADATSITNGVYNAITLVLTTESLIVYNTDQDQFLKVLSLSELSSMENDLDPTLLTFKLMTLNRPSILPVINEDDDVVDMDPVSRARVVDYVRSTGGYVGLAEGSYDFQDFNISPISSTPLLTNEADEINKLTFYINPQIRSYFLCVLNLAKYLHNPNNFSVL